VVSSTLINSQNVRSTEIKSMIAAGNRRFYSSRQICRSTVISKAVKIKIYKIMLKTVVVFGIETWDVVERYETSLGAWKRKLIRTVHGLVVEQGICGRKLMRN
jgi:hypothetical protein